MVAEAITEAAVLASVRAALESAGELSARDDLAIRHTGPGRRRSSLFFLGLAGGGAVCRWVVKLPHSTVTQADLSSPLSAADQHAALQRLYLHLQRAGGGVTTPRPVARVPEIEGFVMEYVPGPTVAALIGPRALLRPGPLLAAVVSSAAVLRAVHSLEPAATDRIDLRELTARAAARARRALAAADLPIRERWLAAVSASPSATAPTVLLHGDFAPENVILSPSGPCCLEPDLRERGWAEQDVTRFLLMLFDAPMFVVGADLLPVRRLRNRAAATFLQAFYDHDPVPETVRPLLMLGLATRWSTRHTDVAHRSARFRRARQLLLRRHFARILDEVSAPHWPPLR